MTAVDPHARQKRVERLEDAARIAAEMLLEQGRA